MILRPYSVFARDYSCENVCLPSVSSEQRLLVSEKIFFQRDYSLQHPMLFFIYLEEKLISEQRPVIKGIHVPAHKPTTPIRVIGK